VHDLLDSDDTRVMLDALRTLGCTLEHRDTGVWAITGLGGMPAVREASLFLGNAGTAMRPLTAALAVLAALHGGRLRCRECLACTNARSATWSMPCASWAAHR
jgi:3-phosphoshikimate 1-carboxyvinyltransferase